MNTRSIVMKRSSPLIEIVVWLMVTGVFFLLGTLAVILVSVILGADRSMLSMERLMAEGLDSFLLINALFLIIALVGPVLVISRVLRVKLGTWFGMPIRSVGKWYGWGVALLVVAYPMMMGIENWVNVWLPESLQGTPQQNWLRNIYERLLEVQSVKQWIGRAIMVAIVPAVVEELYFRGLTQSLLMRWLKRVWPAIVVSAFLFAAMHLQWEGFLSRWIIGILLGFIYWKTRILWIPILLHLTNNLVLLTLGWGFHQGWFPWNPIEDVSIPWYGIALSALMVILLMRHLGDNDGTNGFTEGWTKAYETADPHWAYILEGNLKSLGMHPVLINKRDSAYGFGFVEVWVPRDEVDKARQVIEETKEDGNA